MIRFMFAVLAFCIASTVPALATDKSTCPSGFVCASKPDTVVKALQDAGYKAKIDKNDDGDTMITSAAAGYNFDMILLGCELHALCDSIQFTITFTKDNSMTPEMANDWNSDKRFAQAAIIKDGRFGLYYDVSTKNGLSAANFADVLKRWDQSLGSLDPFFAAHPVKK